MKVTNQEIQMNFKGYEITIPKGTKITNKTAMGYDENYNFISDLSWIKHVEFNGQMIPQYGLVHEATYYGISIPKEKVEEV